MKAAIYYGQNDVRLEEREMRLAGDNLYASICGTDVAVYTHGPILGIVSRLAASSVTR